MSEVQPLYPDSIDNDSSLLEAKDRKETTLTIAVGVSDTIFSVDSTSGWPDTGYISLNGEIVRYLEKDVTHFGSIAKPLERASQDTTASAHEVGDKIYLNILAIHHNVLKDAIIKVEEELGINVKGSFGSVKERIEKLLQFDSDYECFSVEQ